MKKKSKEISIDKASTELPGFQEEAAAFLEDFAAVLHVKVAANCIQIPEHLGQGLVRLVEVTEGLNVFFMDIQLRSKYEFNHVWLRSGPGRSFTMISTLTHENLLMRKKEIEQDLPNTLFGSGKHEVIFTVLPEHRVKAVIIQMTAEWLRKEFREADPDLLFLVHDLVLQQSPVFIAEQSSFSTFHALTEMNDHGLKNPADTFIIKAKTISILYDVLNRSLPGHAGEIREYTSVTQAKILVVEKILENHLQKTLPGLQTIAREVALSESTLKRSFKQIHSVSIYEYYLQKKMQFARKLLEEKPIAVKEVAYILGYEKTSNFIKIFKKHYDFSPGLLKKKFKV